MKCSPRRRRLSRLVLVLLALCPTGLAAGTAPSSSPPAKRCAVVDIDHVGAAVVDDLKAVPGVDWWLELGAELLACGDAGAIAAIAERHPVHGVYDTLDRGDLYLALVLDPTELAELGASTLARSGRIALVHMDDSARARWQKLRDQYRGDIHAVQPDTVVARQLANDPPRARAGAKASVLGLVEMVDVDRWFATLSTLASWSRNTRGAEILLARDWLVAQLQAMPGLGDSVTTPSFTVPPATTAYNVMAVLPGHTLPDDWYVVGGHYDSMPATGAAPGAEDNASGCAGVLELATIFTAHPPEATMIFICYAGEEQGLYGSYHHVDTLIAAGDKAKLRGVLDMDMIGFTEDQALDIFLESTRSVPGAEALNNLFASNAAAYAPQLAVTYSWYPWGSDHMPYLEEGIPAVLTIDDYDEYHGIYHTSNDSPDKIVPAMGEQILRMNVATMAELAGAADPSLFRDGFESGGTTAWSASEPPPPLRMRPIRGAH